MGDSSSKFTPTQEELPMLLILLSHATWVSTLLDGVSHGQVFPLSLLAHKPVISGNTLADTPRRVFSNIQSC
jgi:hypothetical protein